MQSFLGDPTQAIGNLQHFLKLFDEIWPGTNHISYVETPTQRGLKSDPALYVVICSTQKYPKTIQNLIEKSKNNKKCSDVFGNDIAKIFSDAKFNVDWCSLADKTNQGEKKKIKLDFDEVCKYFPTSLVTTEWDDSRPDLSLDFLYVFIVAFVGVLFIAYLTSIMFCRMKGERAEEQEHNQQLLNHKELKRVGAEIRNMSL